jgi:hypothetical protein
VEIVLIDLSHHRPRLGYQFFKRAITAFRRQTRRVRKCNTLSLTNKELRIQKANALASSGNSTPALFWRIEYNQRIRSSAL